VRLSSVPQSAIGAQGAGYLKEGQLIQRYESGSGCFRHFLLLEWSIPAVLEQLELLAFGFTVRLLNASLPLHTIQFSGPIVLVVTEGEGLVGHNVAAMFFASILLRQKRRA